MPSFWAITMPIGAMRAAEAELLINCVRSAVTANSSMVIASGEGVPRASSIQRAKALPHRCCTVHEIQASCLQTENCTPFDRMISLFFRKAACKHTYQRADNGSHFNGYFCKSRHITIMQPSKMQPAITCFGTLCCMGSSSARNFSGTSPPSGSSLRPAKYI